MISLKKQVKSFPKKPGVYIFQDRNGKFLYIGKAGSLRARALSYFSGVCLDRSRAMLKRAKQVSYLECDSVLEALLLEASLIKKCQPKYNIKAKDDKSFLEIIISKEPWPRVLLARSRPQELKGARFGPFPFSGEAKAALKILRRLFPWRDRCQPLSAGACFNAQIGLCPGVCAGKISRANYLKNIRHLKLFLSGQKKRLLASLTQEMKAASRALDFERAVELRERLRSLRHIQDLSLLGQQEKESVAWQRIETYDVSNISGRWAVGSMVVFENNELNKDAYRKFKIKTVGAANDIAMLKEVFGRRKEHSEWPWPNLILVDGGQGQLNVAKEIFPQVPIVAIAKGPLRRNDRLFKSSSDIELSLGLAKKLRDEAHRFALSFHRQLREKLG